MLAPDQRLRIRRAAEASGSEQLDGRTLVEVKRLQHFEETLEQPLLRHRYSVGCGKHEIPCPRPNPGDGNAVELHDLLPPRLRGLPYPEVPNNV